MRHARRFTDITPVIPIQKTKDRVDDKKKFHKQSKKSRKGSTMSTSRGSKPQQHQDGPRTELDYEIERLKAEIQQERQMKEMLEQSSVELVNTISDLEEKNDNVESEDNEWKTRFETQQEMNNQLEKQVVLLREKLGQLKIPSRDGKPSNHLKTYNGLSDAEIRKLMKQLERDKTELQGQLRDLEWRLDNESKAFHKINEERKKYLTELDETAAFIDDTKTKTRQAIHEAQRENEAQLNNAKLRHPNHFGLPDNQRIIDPKRGPVKKVAAVRKLPKLDSSGSGGSKSPGNSPRNS
ncbi:coiled-coil domain-containing protein 169 [Pocillopora verrucosa]|uniref:coiled-coil domain-containing protein 169 n=1 Tax=Pocillopora verrucosa TaxID=203993 RepID=UPI00333F2D99